MWQVYFADWLQDHKIRAPHDKLNVAQAAKEAGQLYKTLTAEQREVCTTGWQFGGGAMLM